MAVLPGRSALAARELHTTDRASSTAQLTALGRTLELRREESQRIVTDCYAPVFLSGTGRTVLQPLRAAAPIVRVLERGAAAAIATSALCRHAYLDAALSASLDDVAQLVILGAGYDSRAYRFAEEIGDRPVFEVDLAPLSRRKASIVRRNRALFGHASVERVEIDFRTQSLADLLPAAGFVAGASTFVAWEGVSPYLSAQAVHDTLGALSVLCGSGSVLAMDCWQQSAGRRPTDRLRRTAERGLRLIGEPITFSLSAGDAGALLAAHDFDLVELAQAQELTARFATDGRRCDPGLYVLTAHRR